ncbi:hypothetical protein L6164_008770 [Bauhinia variegata]|uniref:Uncharacterized protein n=1 Tax=Bauhinia variegata TaxID=167791 RepID=A0ACB9PHT7_BAUVA|nr:hypothetical protein L6164_008770 [Bauhinia variegata]
MAVKEFKQAIVTHKRRSKAPQEGIGLGTWLQVITNRGSCSMLNRWLLEAASNGKRLNALPIHMCDNKEYGALSKILASNRGYCQRCKCVVGLINLKCPNAHCRMMSEVQGIRPVTASQVAEYVLDDSLFVTFSSDSDSDEEILGGLYGLRSLRRSTKYRY